MRKCRGKSKEWEARWFFVELQDCVVLKGGGVLSARSRALLDMPHTQTHTVQGTEVVWAASPITK